MDIAVCRTLHVQSLMRTLIIVAVDEVVELGLLLQEVFAGRLGGLPLQRQMHAVMSAVLCGWPGFRRSISMPSLSHHTDSLDRLKRELGLANGTPLSVRMALGKPNCLKTASNTGNA